MPDIYAKTQQRLERLKEKTYKQPVYHFPGQYYYYVFGFTKAGKVVSLGPYVNESEASGMLATLDDGEIFELKTRDLTKATREIKAELLKRSGDVDESLKKMLHGKGYEREQKREHRS